MSDYNLKKNLAKLKDKPFNFALIQGADSQMLLVSPHRLPAKLIEETKQECGGGKRVAKGLCMLEDGQLVFATRVKPPTAWKAAIKQILRDEKCTNFGPAELRQLKDTESEEVMTEDEEGTAMTPSGAVPPAPPLPPPGPPADAGKIHLERFAALTRKVAGAAIADPAVKKQLAALFAEAKQLATARKFDNLKTCLDKIEALSNSMLTAGPAAGKVQFEKIHLEWDSGKKAIGSRLAALHKAIVSEFNDPQGSSAAKKLDRVLARFNEGLGDTLDSMRNATTPEARAKLAVQSSAIADRYLKYLESDPLVTHLDANPFNLDLQIRQTLSAPLKQLKQQLQQITA